MNLWIDPSGGMAGDMFTAALIDLGVSFQSLSPPMLFAARMLGEARISTSRSDDGALRLKIDLTRNSEHLHLGNGEQILSRTFARFPLPSPHRKMAGEILQILMNAENRAHRLHQIHIPGHEHTDTLHEAQDIIVDIVGACYGFHFLGILPGITQVRPVSTGGGIIQFSHGRFEAPAPATRVLIEEHELWTVAGPVDSELFTPTGAAILAALKPRIDPRGAVSMPVLKKGCSRGTRMLDIPPLVLGLSG